MAIESRFVTYKSELSFEIRLAGRVHLVHDSARCVFISQLDSDWKRRRAYTAKSAGYVFTKGSYGNSVQGYVGNDQLKV